MKRNGSIQSSNLYCKVYVNCRIGNKLKPRVRGSLLLPYNELLNVLKIWAFLDVCTFKSLYPFGIRTYLCSFLNVIKLVKLSALSSVVCGSNLVAVVSCN